MKPVQRAQTDDSPIPAVLRRFIIRRAIELAGIVLLALALALVVSLASWSVTDPSRHNALGGTTANLLGAGGAVVADELMRLVGLGVIPLTAIMVIWAMRLITHAPLRNRILRVIAWVGATGATAMVFSLLPPPPGWPLHSGAGGYLGDALSSLLAALLAIALGDVWGSAGAGMISAVLAMTCMAGAAGALRAGWSGLFVWLRRGARGSLTGFYRFAGDIYRWLANFLFRRRSRTRLAADQNARREPRLQNRRQVSVTDKPAPEGDEDGPNGQDAAVGAHRVTPKTGPLRQRRRAKALPASSPAGEAAFKTPPLSLLCPPPAVRKSSGLSREALAHNARLLEGVLEDFGIRGEILHIRPGPVVTLYELEPAPGLKSSRVIGLADDIARSMSATSARVAVVAGRNAIGIELPNETRETVFLRELLGSTDYERANQTLGLALGKDIGGEPIFADLARMPHLLIAGTTGSGKSVGINTMILSLLYRHAPEQCRLIMIDPKMLELSVYDGIPHLLAPVVTDPAKAVVALKWTVREMEQRYRNMSLLGVRNINGFNNRIRKAVAQGETVTRNLQTGYDPQTGAPVYEEQRFDLEPMPYIVVIIDEMADLMMVAGKDIEGAVQRLAQMARAAGIHVIMATQRPSVDVITGTIKANFPTRISFQVTSKIDSRTILGEQGAEQLLGRGDMLYMAGGSRVTRLHGPFVTDEEVESVVRFLKSQGAPDYVEAVTKDSGEDSPLSGQPDESGATNSLYDQAVAIILKDGKASTSYIQRRLQIGYNRAATLIERMEQDGVISSANHAGKRRILARREDEAG